MKRAGKGRRPDGTGTFRYAMIESRIGPILVVATDRGICRLHFPGSRGLVRRLERLYGAELVEDPRRFSGIARQLRSYLDGRLREFDCDLDFVKGTEFQKRVWRTLLEIPYGQVRSYQWVAEQVGCPRGFRAVGGANHNNPIPLIVPCHRVIGKDGSMVGYGGPSEEGLRRKRELLRMEGAIE